MPPLKVLFVASEVAPFRKTGGLADVAGALPKALRRRGVDVRVVMPLYQGFDWNPLERLDGSITVPMWWGSARGAVRMGRLPGSTVPIYFLEHHRYFDRPYLYGPPGDSYSDNLERFTFLSRGALELCKALGFMPDVIHAHDWQTALVPVFLDTVEWLQPIAAAASVFTIHNLSYQGNFEPGAMFITGLGWEHLHPGEFEHFGDMNLMKAAVHHSTIVSTVSPNYAREIQTSDHGFGLDGVLASRGADLRGILNGIDSDEWDPSRDPHIAAHYSADDLSGKEVCKAALQREMGLAAAPRVPIIAAIGRLTSQKGFDVLARALERILGWDLQLVLLGAGDADAEHYFSSVATHRGEKFRCYIGYNDGLAHRIEAGSDFLIMPSRFEPCGLNQMYSLCYGTLPIVRETGGLRDTVATYDEHSGDGTGFMFRDLHPESVANTVGWAVSTYYDRDVHIQGMRRRGMQIDFSWDHAAAEYEQLYLDAYRKRSGRPFPRS
jgi:starch synthase